MLTRNGKRTLLATFLTFYSVANAQFGTFVPPSVLDACPGYDAKNVKASGSSLTAELVLAGKAYDVFGTDVETLALQVEYETGKKTVLISMTIIRKGGIYCT